MKCTRNREKKVQLLVFWDDQEMDAILLIIGIVYGVMQLTLLVTGKND
jgi:hypothetical protein